MWRTRLSNLTNPGRTGTAVALLLTLGACSGGTGDELRTSLGANTNMPAELVDCMAGLAEEELSPEGIELLIASTQDDSARMEAIRGQMSFTELTEAGMFMVSAATRCGAPLEESN